MSAQVHPNVGFITSTHSQGTSIPTPLLKTFTLQLHMFCTILLGHLCTRECRPFPAKYNQLEGNHHLEDLSLLEDHHPMVGLSLSGDNPLFMFFLEGNLSLPVIPRSLIHRWQGGNLRLLETLHNPGEYLQEENLPNPTLWGTHIITHKEEYQILFLLDHLMDNLIWASQTPPGVLKENNLILPMGLMCIRLRDLLLNILKGNMFILLMGKKITWLIMLRTRRVMQMFLNHHRILLILVSNNRM
jgi:hypothetical protein